MLSADTYEVAVSGATPVLVRLAGIDAVHLLQRCRSGEHYLPCGEDAVAFVRGLLSQAPIRCVAPLTGPSMREAFIASVHLAPDARPSRLAGLPAHARAVHCASDAVSDLAQSLVRAGWAVPEPGSYIEAYRRAREEGAGLHAFPAPHGHRHPADWLAETHDLVSAYLASGGLSLP